MSLDYKPDLTFEENLNSSTFTRGIFDFDIKIGGTLGELANHWKEEMKNWEVKDITDFFSKINIDKASLPSNLQGYFDNLDSSLKAINIDYNQFCTISIDTFNLSVAQTIKVDVLGLIFQVKKVGKIEELYPQNLAKQFSSLNAEVTGGLCSTLVGAAIVTGTYLLEANSDKYDELCKYLRDSAVVVAPAVCGLQ